MTELLHGDCLEVMAGMDAGSVDAVVTDPPYGLSFMGKHWDHGLPGVDFWTEALRLLPPSGSLLAFGGTRTWHRLACALEDAGFEIRDTLMWLYGSGFPKGTACLKPAWEPIILARKPGPKRALGIEACRVGTLPGDYDHPGDLTKRPMARNSYAAAERGDLKVTQAPPNPSGRWPANLILDEEAGAMLDGQTGTLTSGKAPATGFVRNSDKTRNAYGAFEGNREEPTALIGDSGGASRFFYCAKSSRRERNAGCEGMEAVVRSNGNKWTDQDYRVASGERPPGWESGPRQNHHPTVKPLTLMRWLVKLIAYPGDTVLDPFMGSGTTGVACAMEGREFIGIEREAEYIEIARRRIEAAEAQQVLELFA